MPLFAALLSDATCARLIDIFYWCFGLPSYACVAFYVARQHRSGQLIDGRNSPPPFTVSGITGWSFIICVIALIYIAPIFYAMLVPIGIATLLLQTGHTGEEQFGFARLNLVRVASWSLLCFGAVMLIEFPLSDLVLRILDFFHVPHPEQSSVEDFRSYDKISVIMAFMIQAVVLQPMIEELFFRGFLFTFLKKYTSTWKALILSAGIFAFAHLNIGAAIPIWFLGVALGLAYEYSGSLLLPFGIHACWNLVTALSLLLDKGS